MEIRDRSYTHHPGGTLTIPLGGKRLLRGGTITFYIFPINIIKTNLKPFRILILSSLFDLFIGTPLPSTSENLPLKKSKGVFLACGGYLIKNRD
jgi:hypothetical protein